MISPSVSHKYLEYPGLKKNDRGMENIYCIRQTSKMVA